MICFLERNRKIKEEDYDSTEYFQEFWRDFLDVGDVHDLLERLKLQELMRCGPERSNPAGWKEIIRREIAEKGYVIHGIRDTEAWNSLKEGMKRLRIQDPSE